MTRLYDFIENDSRRYLSLYMLIAPSHGNFQSTGETTDARTVNNLNSSVYETGAIFTAVYRKNISRMLASPEKLSSHES